MKELTEVEIYTHNKRVSANCILSYPAFVLSAIGLIFFGAWWTTSDFCSVNNCGFGWLIILSIVCLIFFILACWGFISAMTLITHENACSYDDRYYTLHCTMIFGTLIFVVFASLAGHSWFMTIITKKNYG